MPESLEFDFLFRGDRAAREMQQVGEAAEGAADDLEQLDDAAEQAQRVLERLIRTTRRAASATRDAGEETRESGAAAEKAAGKFARLRATLTRVAAGYTRARERASRFTSGVGRAGANVGGWVTTIQALGGALAAVVPALQRLTEGSVNASLSVAKARVVFGKSFRDLDRWSRKSATSIGFTRTEALAMAGAFGDMASQIGFSGRESVTSAKKFVDLAGRVQLMSAGKLDAAMATEALSAAFRGEYDTLQSVVPTISDAAVKEHAANLQRKSATKLTDEQAQMLAVLDIVQRGTVNSAGLLATAEGKKARKIAEAQARIREQWQEIQANLLPVLSELWSTVADEVVPTLKTFAAWMNSPEGQDGLRSMSRLILQVIKMLQWCGEQFLLWLSTGLNSMEKLTAAGAKLPGKLGKPFRDALPGIRQMRRDVDTLRNSIRNLRGKKVTLTIATVYKNYGGESAARARYSAAGLGRRAAGGPVRAGVGYLMNERGPEIYVPEQRGRVLSAAETKTVLGGGGGGTHVHPHLPYGFVGSKRDLAAAITRVLDTAHGRGQLTTTGRNRRG